MVPCYQHNGDYDMCACGRRKLRSGRLCSECREAGIVMHHHLSKHRRDLLEVRFILEEERSQERSVLRRIAGFFGLC